MKAKRIAKGYYQFENGFVIYFDKSIEGECKWVINHEDPNKIEEFLNDENDQLFSTLKEAIIYIQDY